jgi:hypothetical protein
LDERSLGLRRVDVQGSADVLEEGVPRENEAAGPLVGEPRLEKARQLSGEVPPCLRVGQHVCEGGQDGRALPLGLLGTTEAGRLLDTREKLTLGHLKPFAGVALRA